MPQPAPASNNNSTQNRNKVQKSTAIFAHVKKKQYFCTRFPKGVLAHLARAQHWQC